MKVTFRLLPYYKIRALRNLGSHACIATSFVAYLVLISLSAHGQFSQAQPSISQTATAPPTVTAPTGVYVQTYVDPYTGRQIDTYLEQETVPVLRWEQQEVTERRYVPQWVNETQKTTEVQYVPTVNYQTQARNLNAWNPLLPQRIAYEYIPVTQYQVVNRVVDKPITYQKYIDQEFKVVIPKLVQVTEQRAKYTQRERNAANPMQPASPAAAQIPLSAEQQSAQQALANRNTLGSNYVTRPIQGWGNMAYAGNSYPYSPYANIVASPNFSSNVGSYASSANPFQNGPMQSYPTIVSNTPSFSTVGYQQPYLGAPYQNTPAFAPNYLAQNQPYSQSWFQIPNWMKGNGPLFNQSLLRPATYPNYNANSGYLASNYLPSLFNANNYPQTGYPNAAYPNYSSNNVAGAAYGYSPQLSPSTIASVRPSSAPILPNNNPYGGRDSIQAGLPPSVLR